MYARKEIPFGEFRLDLTNECLWQSGRAISLRPKAFAVLRLLVENRGQLVAKQQILDSVWPGTFVSDAVLKDCIRQLRDALDDDATSPAYIETVHRRGYRFIGKPSDVTSSASTNVQAIPATQALAIRLPSVRCPEGVLGRESELTKMRLWLEQ